LEPSVFQGTSVLNLRLTGNVDARDFALLSSCFPKLTSLDAARSVIVAYTGTEGTLPGRNQNYPAAQLPPCSFYNRVGQQSNLNLEHCLLPVGILSIADSAFLSCASLQDIVLPPNLNQLGRAALMNCTALQTLSFPASLTQLGEDALAGFQGSLQVDASNPAFSLVSDILFSKDGKELILCTRTKTGLLLLPEGVQKIASHAFQNCSKLTGSLLLPTSLIGIGTGSFAGCTGLTGLLTLPKNLQSVGSVAFDGCTGLTALSAPNLRTVHPSAFLHNRLIKLELTDSIDARDFKKMQVQFASLLDIDLSNARIVAYSGLEGTSTGSYPEDVLPDRAFYDGTTGLLFQHVALPSTLTAIGLEAFRGCTALQDVNLPVTLQQIGNAAFLDCKAWTGSLVIPSSVMEIGSSAFAHCTGLTGMLTLPEALVVVGPQAFEGCSGLTGTLTLSGTISSVGKGAFGGCTGIQGLKAGSLHAFDPAAFEQTTIRQVSLSGSLDQRDFVRLRTYFQQLEVADLASSDILTLPDSAFLNSSTLLTVLLPDKLQHLGRAAFQGCIRLDSPLLPAALAVIDERALSGVKGPLRVHASNPWFVTKAGMLFDKTYTELIQCPINQTGILVLPATVQTLRNAALQGCSGLTGSLVLPDALTTIGAYAFAQCSGLTGLLQLPATITRVGAHAFDGCTGFTLLSTPNLRQMDVSAFEQAKLNKIALTSDVDARDFRILRDHLSSMADLDLSAANIVAYTGTEGTAGSGLQTYPADVLPVCAFFNPVHQTSSTALTKIVLPAGLYEIGAEAFRSCSGLKVLELPTSLNVIGGGAYRDCSGLRGKLTIPSSVLSIGAGAFQGCTGLSGELVIPESVAAIGTKAFSGCSGFSGTLTLPGTLTTIGADAFEKCLGLEALQAAVLHITPGSTFQQTGIRKVTLTGAVDARDFRILRDHLTNLVLLDLSSASIAAYQGREGTLGTDSLDYPATGIPDRAFYQPLFPAPNVKLASVFFPKQLTYIGNEAFRACEGLTVVSLPPSVESIGEASFRDCKNLTTPPWTSGLQRVASSAFRGCKSFTGSLTLPANISTVESYAFYDCTGLSALTLPNTVTAVGPYAFAACTGIQTLVVPNVHAAAEGAYPTQSVQELSLTGTIDARDFRSMRDDFNQVRKVHLDRAVISAYTGSEGTDVTLLQYPAATIPTAAFQNRDGLLHVDLPTMLTSIGERAFYGCQSLESIYIAASVNNIGDKSFVRCAAPFTVDPDNAVYADWQGMLFDKNLHRLIQCPISSTGAFQFPASLLEIGPYAFYQCMKRTGDLRLSVDIDSVGIAAFDGCDELGSSLTVLSERTKIGPNAFARCPKLTTLSANNLLLVDSTAFSNSPIRTVELHGQVSTVDFKYLRDFLTVLNEADLRDARLVPNDMLPDGAFYRPWDAQGKTTLSQFKGPATMRVVGRDAFRGCSNLSRFDLPAALTDIGTAAFMGCRSFQGQLSLPAGVENIRDSTWMQCTGLTCVKLENTVKSIGLAAFEGCSALDSLTLPALHRATATSFPYDRIEELRWTSSVDARDFRMVRDAMNRLKMLDLRDANIDDYRGAEGTTSSIAYSRRSIPADAFYDIKTGKGCTTLEQVLLPAALDTIDAQSFRGCLGMKSIEIPAGVEFIGSKAFLDFGGPITVQEADTAYSSLEGILYNKVQTKLIQAPISFAGALRMPQTVTQIEPRSLMHCTKLTEVFIPAGVHTIHDESFCGCSGLEQIDVYRQTPLDIVGSKDVFKDVSRTTCRLNVPISSLLLYEMAPVWSEFLNATTLVPIVVDSLVNLVVGCETSTPTLHYRLRSGNPEFYRILFADSTLQSELKSTELRPLPASDSIGILDLNLPSFLKPGRYSAFLLLQDHYGLTSDSLPFAVEVRLSNDLLHVKFDRIVFIENRSNEYRSYQWYKNAKQLPGATNQYYRDPEGLFGSYAVEVTDSSGRSFLSCPMVFNQPLDDTQAVQVFPNPVQTGRTLGLEFSRSVVEQLPGSNIYLYDTAGAKVLESNSLSARMELQLNLPMGNYIGVLMLPDGRKHAFEVSVSH
jgi:hypothetical protein